MADVDPIKKAEEGLIGKFGTTRVQGLKVVNLRARLQAKIAQLERGKKAKKVKKDILQLTASSLKEPEGFFSKGGLL